MLKRLTTIGLILIIAMLTNCEDKSTNNNNDHPTYEEEGAIGESGGTVQITDEDSDLNGSFVNIPDGALTANTTIKISEAEPTVKIPGDTTLLLVKLEPHGLTFDEPVEIGIPFHGSGDIENAKVYFFDPDSEYIYQMPVLDYDSDKGVVIAQTNHFSYYTTYDEGVAMNIEMLKVDGKIGVRVYIKGYSTANNGLQGVPPNLFNLYHINAWNLLLNEPGRVNSSFNVRLFEEGFFFNDQIDWCRQYVERIDVLGGYGARFRDYDTGEILHTSGKLPENTNGFMDEWFDGKAILFVFEDVPVNTSKDYFVKVKWALAADPTGGFYQRLTPLYEFNNEDDARKYNDMTYYLGDGNGNFVDDYYEANSAPAVSITAPANNSHHTIGNSVSITTSASDGDGSIASVKFYVDGSLKTTDTSSPYGYSWSTTGYSAGSHTIRARATDDDGATTDAEISVILDSPANQSPAVSITAPANNSHHTIGSSVNISASASDGDGSIASVKFYVDGSLKTTDTSSPYSYSWSTTGYSAGSHTIRARATDDDGATTDAEISVILDSPANQSPVVSITAPAYNSHHTIGNSVNISASASDADGSIASVKFYVDGSLKNTDTSSPYSYNWSTTGYSAGSHTIRARATDDDGASTDAEISVILDSPDNQAPVCTITSPADGATFELDQNITFTVDATDADGFIDRVRFYTNDVLKFSDTDAPYEYIFSSNNLGAGSHTLKAIAVDDDDAETNAEIAITISSGGGGGPGEVEWVLVPAGDYTWGENDATRNIAYDYYVSKYEITNAEYVAYLEAALAAGSISATTTTVTGYYAGDEHWGAGTYEFLDLDDGDCRIAYSGGVFSIDAGYEDHPVVEVTWFGANAYALYYGWTLPTEEEWEKAARGNTGYDYPWGNSIDGSRANYANSGDPYDNGTTPVGYYDGSNHSGFQTTDSPSPYGAYDMAGNVWEWTLSFYSPSISFRVLRGGGWDIFTHYWQAWYRNINYPYGSADSADDYGFRVSRTD
jgi:formylglycine-generating enzyme required for sulfatase activity